MTFAEALSKVFLGTIVCTCIGIIGMIAGFIFLWGHFSGVNSTYLLRGSLLLISGLALCPFWKIAKGLKVKALGMVTLLIFLPL